ncbi:DNA polymerase theta-like [Mya arenaria]|uniref:DNA polymerase theta-like n=1 Tax=Mya arenaria TaxID=6604 RepID=UPI0022E71DDB|nr:DNA polymerase theta-like [Mya arenaria]
MNASRNVGRKRLGRLPIQCSKLSETIKPIEKQPVKRSCQINASSHQGENSIARNVGGSSKVGCDVDLSFSSSFVSDLENDPGLASALDKLEKAYSTSDQSSASNSHKQCTENSTAKLVENATKYATNSCKPQNAHGKRPVSSKNSYSRESPGTSRKEIICNVNGSIKQNTNLLESVKTPLQNKGQKDALDDKNFTSFHDLSFASPIDISTPQIFKINKSQTRKRRPSSSSNVSTSHTGCIKTRNISSTSTPLSTPRISRHKNSAGKIRKKQVLAGLTPPTSLTESNASHQNKSDFFKSLCVDNDSVNESEVDLKLNSGEPSNGNAGRKDITVKPVCANIDTNLHVDIEEDGSNQTKADGKENLDSGAPVKIQPSLGCDELSLGSWGLPAAVVQQYEGRGVSHMFPWQAECLLTGNVLSGGNLVYSAPTSAGKTMVAELLMLKRVLETRKKAIFILPFVSVTREKMFYLQELYQDAGIRVGGFMGHHSPAGGFSNVDVAVCTIEKGNSLINRLLEENKLHQLGILVVDELHLIGDAHRGYLLELLLTKVTYMCSRASNTEQGAEDLNVQLVGMSATLPNLDLLAGWLRADLYRTDFRPVPLTECVKIGTNLYDSSMKLLRQVDVKYAVKGDDDHIVPLCIETVREGHSILIFCPTKVWCEKLAETVAREIYMLLRDPTRAVHERAPGQESDVLVLPLNPQSLRDTLEQLRRTPVGLDQVLGKSVQYGVAYHHAGLTFDERDIVEGAFRQGIIKVLVATSTLSSGVNLPARRVLVRTPVFHGHIIDFLTYKQMIGRAGRKGVDTAGESILLVKPSERSKAEQLVGGALPPVHSTLIRDKGESLSSSLKRAILEVVVSGVASCPRDVEVYASCTLLAASLHGETDPCNAIQECIDFLLQNEFITVQNVTDIHGVSGERYVPTQLGAAVLSSSISPDEGLAVFSELQKARQCFVLENELHIIYQVTPIYAQIDGIDWLQYFSMWEGLSPGMRRVAELVGVKESFLVKAIRGRIPTSTPAQLRTLAVHRRFYTCLALHDLVHEVPINDVCKKYNCNKGQLQSLQQSGATFAGMVTVFCARLGWSNLELILSQFQSRLTFGVQRELCDLVRISALNGQRARVLYNGGFQTVAALAGASAPDIEALLKKTAPFQSMKKQESETAWEAEERRKAHCIFLTGRRGVTELEAATIIIDEAKQIIQDELGGVGVQWGPKGKPPTPKVKTPVLLSPLASGSKKRRFGQQGKALYEKKQSPINRDTSLGKADISVLAPPVLQLASTARIGTTGGEGNGNKLSEEQQGEAAARPERAGGEGSGNKISEEQQGEAAARVGWAGREGSGSNISEEQQGEAAARMGLTGGEGGGNKIIEEQQGEAADRLVQVGREGGGNKISEEQQGEAAAMLVRAGGGINMTDQGSCTSEQVGQQSMHSRGDSGLMGKNHASTLIPYLGKEVLGNNQHINNKSAECVPVCEHIQNNEKNLVSCNSSHKNGLNPHTVDRSVITTKAVIELVSHDKSVKAKSNNNPECDKIPVEHLKEKVIKKFNSLKDVIQDCVEDISFSTALDDLESNDEFFQNIDINDKLPVSERSCDKISCGNSSSQEIQELEKGTVVSNPSGLENNRNDINMDTEFTESFAVDTQVMDVVNRVENICKADKHVVDNGCKQKTERPYSEALFSDLMPDDSFDMMANELSQMPGKEINSVPVSNNVQTSEGSENNSILYSSSSFNNGLDMNISHGSTEDMFNNSVGLIAASNYERVALADDSRLSSAALSRSFEDLHIPYQSGQEKCFEGGDKGNIVVRANMCTELGKSKGDMIKKPPGQHGANIEQRNTGSNMGILGQFSSQKDTSIKHSLSKEKIHEDLAVVLAMGESFSSTFNMTAANHNNEQINNQANSEDVFGDSMTVSMMESVGSISEQNIPKSTGVISNNKLHSTKENEQKEMKLSKLDTKDGSEFVTPSRRPRKRASLSSCSGKKSSKIQKMKDDNYTTPVKAPSNNESEKIVYNKSIQSKRKKNDSEVSNSETVCSASSSKSPGGDMNTSTGSDYVPPTPPDEAPTGVPGVGRSPANTPRKLQGATFSPRLKRSLIATTSKLSGTTIGNFSLKKRELLKNVSQSRSSNKGSSKIMSDRNGNNKVVRKLTETQTRNKRSQSEGLNRTNDAKFIFGPGKTPVTELQTEGGIYNDKDVNNIEDDHIEVLNEVDENDDKLSPSFIDPDMSGVPLTQQSFSIIDVCGDKRLFKMFIMEWRTKSRYAVSLACEKLHTENTGTAIGANFRKDVGSTYTDQGGIPLEQEGLCIVGIAVSWDNRDAYYVSFTQQQPQGDPDDSLAPPPIDKDISFAIRVKAVKSVLQQATCQSEPVTILMFDVKTQYRALVEGCGFHPKGRFEDPKIACWILDPGAKEKNLHRMVTNFLPSEVHMIHGIGGGIGVGSLGMSPANPGSGRYRATTEAVLVRHLAMYFQACLEKEGTLDTYTQVEMSAAVTLCRMELNGFGFSQEESERQKSVMLSKLSALEQQVYQMAGHPFSLSATEDVAQVLFIELKLPPNGDPSSIQRPLGAHGRRGGPRGGTGRPQYSTSKDILEKLRKLHPLPGLILEWRRITNALTKTVFPLQREKVRCDWLDMERIYGDCQLHTATGRVSMTEPNLQNVPKDFDIMLPDIIGESPPPHMSASERRMTRARRRQGQGEGQVSVVTGDGAGGTFSVSMRHAFVPFKDGMLLAADYSQLELRMIAHLSCDQKLIRVLNEDGDVFKLITAQWKNISPDEVTADQRAQAKQVCYGMIYGIGAKALGEQLEVEENDAAVFIETFKARYPVMRAYLRQTVDQCRMDGFVKTILGRKRYLPGITSTQPHARAQAERQAVNTTVQGSAADLVKTAMVRIDDRLAKMFPATQYTHRHKLPGKHPSRQKCPPAGGYLVLQLHDELIYEVSSEHMADLARVVKQCMENTMELSVRMPVKIKVGASWGKLQDYTA